MTLRVGDSIELPFYNHFDQRDVDAYMNQWNKLLTNKHLIKKYI